MEIKACEHEPSKENYKCHAHKIEHSNSYEIAMLKK